MILACVMLAGVLAGVGAGLLLHHGYKHMDDPPYVLAKSEGCPAFCCFFSARRREQPRDVGGRGLDQRRDAVGGRAFRGLVTAVTTGMAVASARAVDLHVHVQLLAHEQFVNKRRRQERVGIESKPKGSLRPRQS